MQARAEIRDWRLSTLILETIFDGMALEGNFCQKKLSKEPLYEASLGISGNVFGLGVQKVVKSITGWLEADSHLLNLDHFGKPVQKADTGGWPE